METENLLDEILNKKDNDQTTAYCLAIRKKAAGNDIDDRILNKFVDLGADLIEDEI